MTVKEIIKGMRVSINNPEELKVYLYQLEKIADKPIKLRGEIKMEYKNYEDLKDADIWTTDGINCNFALQGKDYICTELEPSEANFMVPAETLPENL